MMNVVVAFSCIPIFVAPNDVAPSLGHVFFFFAKTEPISNAESDFLYLMRFHFQFLATALQKDPMADFAFRISADFFKNFIQYKQERGFVHAAVERFLL